MRLSTKARYALLGLMELAIHDKQRPVPLVEISKRLGISLSYVEQLFAVLRNEGFVKGTRGPGGGYRLTQKAWDTSMARIFTLFENHAEETGEEVGMQPSTDAGSHLVFTMWDALSHEIYRFLDGITFSGFVTEQLGEKKERSAA